MRHTSATAALLAPAVIGALGLTPAPASAASPASPTARAAWIKSCYDKKHQEYDPCGHWRLRMRDGREVTVRGAATRGVDGRGRERHGEDGTFAVSADGRVLAYERAGDHRLVVRRVTGGPVTELPRSAMPKGIGSEEMNLRLSPSGDRVLIDYLNDPGELPTKVITVATGKTMTLPAAYDVRGFSADGDEVLATRGKSDNTTALYVLRVGGGSIHRTPPAIVANALTYALAADGTTVAFVTGGTNKPRARTYDLTTGEVSASVDLPLKPDLPPELAWWSGEGRLTAVARTGQGGEAAVVRVLTVDFTAGQVTKADTYSISSKNHTFNLAGE
ncbi:hypothetical protein [Nonomuraea insulae]|uniref:Protein TolB n=1 Tax=Nonomuraea insulae TaxID=1616787 RepID=A0ABW1D3U8_9ACTN